MLATFSLELASPMIEELVLIGSKVKLTPLKIEHVDALFEVGRHPELWRLQPRGIDSIEKMKKYVQTALDEQTQGTSRAFVVEDICSAKIVGSTRFSDFQPQHYRLEIGFTWLTPSFQRSGANTDMKLLMLSYAFDWLQINRVIFRTEVLNEQSAAALIRLGATPDGVFRQHLFTDSGRARDIAYFSILREQWPSVRLKHGGRTLCNVSTAGQIRTLSF
jgi:N-acetyltransferase